MSETGLYAVAFGAGMLASVNPCGFALLPAYLSLLILGTPDEAAEGVGRGEAVRRALMLTAAMTAGFVLVFGVFGLVVQPVAAGAQAYLPWFTLLLGLGLAGIGGWLLAGRAMPSLRLPGRSARSARRPLTRSPMSMLGFGAAYATASLTCTIAPFLAVVVTSFRAGSAIAGAGLFVAYAAGMGLVVGTLAVATALASEALRGGLVARVRSSGAALSRAAGLLLLAAGAYVAWYAGWELRVLGLLGGEPGAVDDPLIGAAASLQRALAEAVAGVGARGWLLIAAVLLALASAVALARGRRGVRSRRG